MKYEGIAYSCDSCGEVTYSPSSRNAPWKCPLCYEETCEKCCGENDCCEKCTKTHTLKETFIASVKFGYNDVSDLVDVDSWMLTEYELTQEEIDDLDINVKVEDLPKKGEY